MIICPTYKLIIEIDGPIHKQQQHYDQAGTEQLEAFGYRVLRLTNQQVLDDIPSSFFFFPSSFFFPLLPILLQKSDKIP
jgi:hypothetical protein